MVSYASVIHFGVIFLTRFKIFVIPMERPEPFYTKMAANWPSSIRWKSWYYMMRIPPEYNFRLLDQMTRWHIWASAQYMHFWQLKWPPFGHFWSDWKTSTTMLIPINRPIILRGNSKICFRCAFLRKSPSKKEFYPQTFFFHEIVWNAPKIILSKI